MTVILIVLVVSVTAALTRWIRQSPRGAPLRQRLSDTSPLAAKMLSCGHCLSFWIALGFTLLVWSPGGEVADAPDVIQLGAHEIRGQWLLEFGLFVLLGWRGAYFINRSLDRRQAQQERDRASTCGGCGAPHQEEFLSRGGLSFCSTTCWFDFLRQRPMPREQLVNGKGELIPQEIYPMSYKDLTPIEAKELLQGDENCVYVDVRSIPEFQNGHPVGSWNVPVMHREALGMVPNPDFLTVMQVHFDLERPLIIGCQSGQRSVEATQALIAAGYKDVSNVRGGFGGVRDASGAELEKGWFSLGLPVDYGEPEGRSYSALAGGRQGQTT
ncbi:MAG: rhodanese-like domain-containing protein [Candidatus Latescibacterota bacterium]|nr:rhodanese-like domain-containing protein [Candidatus Latescibacterota bacterium]